MKQPIPPAVHPVWRVVLAAAIVAYGVLLLSFADLAIRGGIPRVAFDGTASLRAERVLSGSIDLAGMGAELHLGAAGVSSGSGLMVQGSGRLRIGDAYLVYGFARAERDLRAGPIRFAGGFDIDPSDTGSVPRAKWTARHRAETWRFSRCRASAAG